MPDTPFVKIDPSSWIVSNALAFAVWDGFPVSKGHTLVITKRVVPTWFEATPEEQAALMSLVNDVKAFLESSLDPKPDGFNVGFNCGESAGQTVMHVHIHVIPRYQGDVPDPRGGVRYVIPDKANYLIERPENTNTVPKDVTLELSTGYPNAKLWDHLSDRMVGAKQIDILASFVQSTGLDVIKERLFDVMREQVTIRILVSDYLHISDPKALRRLLAWTDMINADSDCTGALEVRLVEVQKMPTRPDSFHPKAWRIVDELGAFVAVGSSNLSKPALQTGVEWNLLYSSREHHGIPDNFAREFEALWNISTPLSPSLVTRYAEQVKQYRKEHFEPEAIDTVVIPEPRPWQLTALESLRKLRVAGYNRALVSVATGMGKTWLAAFDACQVGDEIGKRPRVLIIAHRSHILAQAESVFSMLLDSAYDEGKSSWYIGERSEFEGDIVVASVQKLSRPQGLMRLAREQFDYVVIDEVHHAEAPTYRRVLAKLHSRFTLGLTATPERTDGVDVASIFDDNLAHHASIGDGIVEESLVPFHYIGIKDTVDFRQIPWRNGRFDQEELEQRVLQSERMDRLWATMQDHPADRTIVFCCSRRHALFTRDWLLGKGIVAAAVFSGAGGDSCGRSLESLRSGKLQALCVVDMFNEGLDIPSVDRVIMLRPTESKIIFLQQLGRGLRAAEGKSRLLVIDFVGNHRIFAQRIIHLLSLQGKDANWETLKNVLNGKTVPLPPECLLDIELTARDMLKQFIPVNAQAGVEAYGVMRDEVGRRPTPVELLSRGYLPKTISAAQGNWFSFVHKEGDLNESETKVLEECRDWFITVETTSLFKSYKMVVLRVLLDNAIFMPIDLVELSRQCRRYLLNHPVLRRDLIEGRHSIDHFHASDEQWTKWWLEWPIDRWLDEQKGKRWFTRIDDAFVLNMNCPDELKPTFEAMTAELVDWRLAAYAKGRGLTEPATTDVSFTAKISHAEGRAILFVPEESKAPGRPVGPTAVQLPNGSVWEFKFVKVACNIARPVGSSDNQLTDLLRSWFGNDAGVPGTDFHVRFRKESEKWIAEPVRVGASTEISSIDNAATSAAKVAFQTLPIEVNIKKSAQYSTHVPVIDLSVAAGFWSPEQIPEPIGWIAVPKRKLKKGMFVAQVAGHSMEPKLPDGSWCLFKPCPAGSRQGRLVLVQLNTDFDPEDGGRYTVKMYSSSKITTNDGVIHQSIELLPLNPSFKPIVITAEYARDVRIFAEFDSVIDVVKS